MNSLGISSPPLRMARPVVAVLITWLLKRLVFAAVGFHYAVFSEPFSATKLAVDFGTWVAIYASVWWLLARRGRT
ncbi:hypothetical protein [Gemmatimonas sp.]|uniref:hypothetical protein n=1 Tax=Gemmatimonas sp. TaxID=1962908 RepID=UPI00333FC0B2